LIGHPSVARHNPSPRRSKETAFNFADSSITMIAPSHFLNPLSQTYFGMIENSLRSIQRDSFACMIDSIRTSATEQRVRAQLGSLCMRADMLDIEDGCVSRLRPERSVLTVCVCPSNSTGYAEYPKERSNGEERGEPTLANLDQRRSEDAQGLLKEPDTRCGDLEEDEAIGWRPSAEGVEPRIRARSSALTDTFLSRAPGRVKRRRVAEIRLAAICSAMSWRRA
jgi:hypothetical protein